MSASNRRPFGPCAGAWLLLLLGSAVVPAPVGAQAAPSRTWGVVPFLGFGAVLGNDDLDSAGMESALGIEYGGATWRWDGYASIRGLGVGCSHSCFDGGPAVTLGVARSFGALRIGGGVGAMKQLGEWHPLPFGRLSLDAALFRVDVRVELPGGDGPGVYVPILIGFPLST